MTSLIFVRHAESLANAGGIISSSVPGPQLSPEGHKQAAALAERFLGRVVDAVYSSPALRAVTTAIPLARHLATSVVEHAGLVELAVGELDGIPAEIGLPRLNEGWDRWMNEGLVNEPVAPGGESATSVVERMRVAIDEIRANHPVGSTIAIVSHGGILQLAIPALCANLESDHGYRRWLRNTESVETVGSEWPLRCLAWAGEPVAQAWSVENGRKGTEHG